MEKESFQEAYYRTFIFYANIDNVIGGLIMRCNAVKCIKERFDVIWNYLDCWCRRRGASAPPKLLIWWKSGQNHLKSRQNLWKYGQNVWIPSQNRCMCFDFTKMAPKINVQTFVFFWRSCFHLVLFGQVRGNLGKLGEIWAKSFAPPKICLLLHLWLGSLCCSNWPKSENPSHPIL